jgi:formate dehydrogenase iron-sulfur subunit
MNQANLEVRAISGHAGSVPGAGLKREFEVCKLIDTSTCIGCKACEVACLEWNGYSFSETVFNNSYQTMPDTAWNYWNLIRFNEHEHPEHGMMLLMRKDQCMHCADPGCLTACPADGAIVQYVNGIVDFQQDNCIGCGYCMTGCPFNIPKVQPGGAQSFQVHVVRGPRERGTRAGVHQIVPDRVPAFRHQGRHEVPCRESRQAAPRCVRV